MSEVLRLDTTADSPTFWICGPGDRGPTAFGDGVALISSPPRLRLKARSERARALRSPDARFMMPRLEFSGIPRGPTATVTCSPVSRPIWLRATA